MSTLQRLIRRRVALFVCAWAAVLLVGFMQMARFEFTAGASASREALSDTAVRAQDGATVMMFVHPRCPCTPASLTELARVLKDKPSTVRTQIVFYTPLGADDAWTSGDVWTRAKAIEGAEVLRDAGGALAKKYTARTSGQVMVFGAKGELVFEGGITAGRGMTGDNAGARALARAVRGEVPDANHTPVYGCGLQSAGDSQPPEVDPSEAACPECTLEEGA